MMRRVLIAESERAFVLVDGAFRRFLGPGEHWLVYPFARVEVRRVSILEPRLAFPDAEVLASHPEVAREVVAVRVKDTERGLLFKGGNFAGFLAPGFHAFLRTPQAELVVEIVDITGLVLEHPKRDVLVRFAGSGSFLRVFDVADGHRGVLYVDQRRERLLHSGRHYFWTGVKELAVLMVDMREQTLEVQGQELMTQDKVSLRINVTARFRVTDLEKALESQVDYRAAFYRDLQLSLRDEVGARTLDDLLGRKEEMRLAMVARVKPEAAAMGLTLLDAGIRDVILPGEMRTIFNQVIEAEKRAQANMIARREETAATRNLMNTAKLLEQNPVLMRLKELETTEKLAEKIGSMSVVGGLDGVMKAFQNAVRLDTPRS